jgi:hypothetical protein
LGLFNKSELLLVFEDSHPSSLLVVTLKGDLKVLLFSDVFAKSVHVDD